MTAVANHFQIFRSEDAISIIKMILVGVTTLGMMAVTTLS